MAHDFLDNKVLIKMYKYGLLTPKRLAPIKGSISFVTDLFTKFHVIKLFSSIFGLNSFIKNLSMSFLNYYYEARFVFNLGWLLYGNEKKIQKKLSKAKIINIESYHKALKCNSPLILLSAHTGLYYLAMFTGSFFPKDRDVVMFVPKQFEGQRKKIMETRILNYKKSDSNIHGSFITVDLQDKFNLVKILGTFKKNGLLASTCDFAFPFTKNRIHEFCNMEKEFPIGIIEMGLKFNANIIPIFNYMEKGKYVVEYGQVLSLKSLYNKEQNINRYFTTIMGLVEAKACQVPEQYTLWKTLFFRSAKASKHEKIIESNNKQFTFMYHAGVYFTKNYFKNKPDPCWISGIKNYLPHSYNLVSDYIYLNAIPPTLFTDSLTANEMINNFSIKRGVKAFSKDGNIYCFFYEDETEWKKIINHEMYLCGVYQFFEGKILIPDWFNESISFYLNKDISFDPETLSYYINENYQKIVSLIIEDTLIDECAFSVDIMKSFGKFFFEKYDQNSIKNLFIKIKEENSFEKGLSSALDCNIQPLLDSWYSFIQCSMPMSSTNCNY